MSLDVRQFALPCPRRGSIELHSGYGAPPMSGQEIHLAIQRRRQKEFDDYTPEKRLSWVFEAGPYEFHISGRADGITANPVQIEEIKTAFDVEELSLRKTKRPFPDSSLAARALLNEGFPGKPYVA